MKIIPAIDLMEGNVVRLYRGNPDKKTIYSDNPVGLLSICKDVFCYWWKVIMNV